MGISTMSQETMTWLNTMTLIGFADKRGKAWHYRAELQGNEPNHYPDAIPLSDAERRLFNFGVLELPCFVQLPSGEFVQLESGRKAMCRDDMAAVGVAKDFGVFKPGFQGHAYKPWLLRETSNIAGEGLGLASVGLLREGAQAWASFELPETFKSKMGADFRTFLLSYTSYDGSLATGWKLANQLAVCDNTLEIARSENGNVYKVKHTKYSGYKLKQAREALNLVVQEAERFEAEVERLCNWKVTALQFQQWLDAFAPIPSVDVSKDKQSTRGKTLAVSKREKLTELYLTDQRCSPWVNTAFGVLQAVNTYQHHEGLQRGGVHRAIRNMENVVNGKTAQNDNEALDLLTKVCA